MGRKKKIDKENVVYSEVLQGPEATDVTIYSNNVMDIVEKEEKTVEEIKEVLLPEPPPKEDPKKIPIVTEEKIPSTLTDVPMSTLSDNGLVNLIAKRTCVKFIGGWWHLVSGKSINVPKNIAQVLISNGFAE